jgi:hypothetical protein
MYRNRREKKAMQIRESNRKTMEFWKEKEEKAKKKSELISSLQSVLTELSKKRERIQSDIDSNIKEHTQKLEEIMKQYVMKVQKCASTEQLPQFQIDESFMDLVSDSNLRLKEISEQMKFIDDLIQKVSLDLPDIEISEHEQKIIEILSAKSFFISPDVASVRKMIDSCSNMRNCLERSKTYLDTFISKMMHEISVRKRNPGDFNVDSDRFKLEHQKLEELLQQLSELNQEIEKRIFYFSTKSLVECIFSIKSDEFSSISEDTQTFQDRIKEMKKRFSNIKKSLVDFVQIHIDNCKDFILEINYPTNDYDCRSDDENDSSHEEPIVYFRKDLEHSLDQIRRIIV